MDVATAFATKLVRTSNLAGIAETSWVRMLLAFDRSTAVADIHGKESFAGVLRAYLVPSQKYFTDSMALVVLQSKLGAAWVGTIVEDMAIACLFQEVTIHSFALHFIYHFEQLE